MAAKERIFVSQKQSRDQNLKNHFPKDIFNEIWLKVEEHECMHSLEISFENIILFKKGGQNKTVTSRNNAYLC